MKRVDLDQVKELERRSLQIPSYAEFLDDMIEEIRALREVEKDGRRAVRAWEKARGEDLDEVLFDLQRVFSKLPEVPPS